MDETWQECNQDVFDRIARLIGEADGYATEKKRSGLELEKKERTARLNAALEMRKAEISGIPKTELYSKVGLTREQGRYYFKLAEMYADVSLPDIEAQKGNLLSLNQAGALAETINRAKNPNDKARILNRVRDNQNLLSEDYGPKQIKQLLQPNDELDLTEWLEKNCVLAPDSIAPDEYEAVIECVAISVTASSLPLFIAALTKGPQQTLKALEWFQPGGKYEIRKVA